MKQAEVKPIHNYLGTITSTAHYVPNIDETWEVNVMSITSEEVTQIGVGKEGITLGLVYKTKEKEVIVFNFEQTYENEEKVLKIKSSFFNLSAEDFGQKIICDTTISQIITGKEETLSMTHIKISKHGA